ncbi:hypothetical protein AwDysgo_01750 [Bacteroidales bacterium]|nr:hypothetical protein AwDysgo_01750 [Bacteroidales bacterium]
MNRKFYFNIVKNIVLSISAAAYIHCYLCGCASPGVPSGGAYDVEPPVYLRSIPDQEGLNFQGNKVEIFFDELIKLEKPGEKIIITPPQKMMPVIKGQGRKVSVAFQDSMIPNTTYTLDFTNSIVDNNEKNPLENFSFAFSTGESLDSLVIAGKLLNAENLEPMPNILIGLHSDLSDTAFVKNPFLRTTQTNDKGEFWVRNVAHGSYHIFALKDANRNYIFDQPAEDIAFLDSLIVPSFDLRTRQDTTFTDSLSVDTIINVAYNHFSPDHLRLFLFKESFGRHYLVKSERQKKQLITLSFSLPPQASPQLHLLGQDKLQDWLISDNTEGGTIFNYWIKDSTIFNKDSLKVEVIYLKSDSLNQLLEQVDTINLSVRRANIPKKTKNKGEEEIEFLGLQVSAQSTIEVFDTIKIKFAEPLLNFYSDSIRIEQKVDTLWEARNFQFRQDSLDATSYFLTQPWAYGSEFRIRIDSASFKSIYGPWNNKYEGMFKIREEEEYSHLDIDIEGASSDYGFGELLDASDRVVRKAVMQNKELVFSNLKPGKYYLRFVEDLNNNHKWDAGKYSEKRQSEKVFYYHEAIEMRQNWELRQTWNILEIDADKQKPLEITKNKPEAKKTNRNETQK